MHLFEIPQKFRVYKTKNGLQLKGDCKEVLRFFPNEPIVDLIITSPPFALLRKKSYGNKDQDEYVKWFSNIAREAYRVLRPTGSLVVDLGGAYQKGRPIRSLYNYRVLIELCDNIGFNLAQDFFWYNPAKLPSPIEWVNKRKIRVKDSVNTVWWLSKGDFPKANVNNVLKPYSKRMKELLKNPDSFYEPKKRPSGHDISNGFANDKGGAIPPNLLEISNTASNTHYLRTCEDLNRKRHPARFPSELPKFFIQFLTEPNDLVVDIFSGSNTTGFVSESLHRRWISIEKREDYAYLSIIRFTEGWSKDSISELIQRLESGEFIDLRNTINGEIQMQLL
jgi:site-specific DNA-methyltransferase (cytosine-N4-specific)